MTPRRLGFSALAVLAVAACALATAPAPVHPYHLSTAEVECNAAKRRLEVSLAVLAIDFEETLSRRAGHRINLDRTEGVDAIIENYLADRFVVTLPDGTKPRPSYVGREDAKKIVWLYFTVPLVGKSPGIRPHAEREDSPQGRAPAASLLLGTRLRNRVLMEMNATQRNTVILHEGRWRRPMLFEQKTQEQVLRQKPSDEDGQSAGKADSKSTGKVDSNAAGKAATKSTGKTPTQRRPNAKTEISRPRGDTKADTARNRASEERADKRSESPRKRPAQRSAKRLVKAPPLSRPRSAPR